MLTSRRLKNMAKQALGREAVGGSFDGLSGRVFSGWVAGEGGSLVHIKFGDRVVGRCMARTPRPDLLAAGVQGWGFVLPASGVELELRRLIDAEAVAPASLHATDTAGRALTGGSVEIEAGAIVDLIAVSMAFRVLGAPIESTLNDPT